MPRFKQPIPLQKLAFDSVIGYAVHYCDEISIKGFLTKLRQGVTVIKQHVSDHMSRVLYVEFCKTFLDNFYGIGRRRSGKRPDSHNRAALEIIMDVEFVGLTCEGRMLHYLDPADAHRLQGLKTLDWSDLQYCERVPKGLENFRLQDLTTFIFPGICTDFYLEIIGPRCLKLEILKIQESEKVTDRGLRALRLCSELRIINLHYCQVSDDGVNELLSVHKKLEEFNVGDYFTIGEESFNVLSRRISLVCPSVKRFSLKSNPITNAHLHSVVALFPNLTYLGFCCPFKGDLCILRDLKNLTNLLFGLDSSGFSMENLKQLLMSVGASITRLTLRSDVCVTQNDLNFIFKICGNIELLCFCYEASRPIEKLTIPPFQKLKYLECDYLSRNGFLVELEFGEMLSLEVLTIQGFHAIFEITELLMRDNVKFPNFREVRIF